MDALIEAGPTAVASVGAAGFLATAASAASLADITIKFGAQIKKRIWRSMKDDIESFGFDAAMIYSKIARRAFLYGIIATGMSGAVAFDIPGLAYQPEVIADYTVGGVSALTFLTYIARRRFQQAFGPKIIVSQHELRFLLAYERLIDDYIAKSIHSNRAKRLTKYVSDEEFELLTGVPRAIAGNRDVYSFLGRRHAPDLSRIVSRWSRQSLEFANLRALLKSRDPVFQCIAQNNIAVLRWHEGELDKSLRAIEKAQKHVATIPALGEILSRNRGLIEHDRYGLGNSMQEK